MSISKSHILFSIGVIGGDSAKAKFAMVAGAVYALTTKINTLVKESQAYSQALKNVTIDMSEYNKVTNGLINTMDGLQGAVKLQNTGLDVSAKNLKALGIAAVSYNQSIGGGPEGATTIFNRLVKSISAGNERALVPFGIQLTETEDKFKAGTEAIEKFTEKFGDMDRAMAQTGHETMFQLNNNWGTYIDQTLSAITGNIGQIDSIKNLNNALETTTTRVEATNGAYAEYTWSLSNMTGLLKAQVKAFYGVDNALDTHYNKLNRVYKLQQELTTLQRKEKANAADVRRLLDVTGENDRKAALAKAKAAADAKKKKKKGDEDPDPKPGGRRRPEATMGFTLESIEQMEDEERFGVAGAAMLAEVGTDANLSDIVGTGSYMADDDFDEIDRLMATKEQRWQVELEAKQQEKELQQEHHQWLLENDKAYAQVALEQRRQQMTAYAGSMATMFGNLSSLMDTENKKAFRFAKGAAISSAVINTSLAAIKAYQSLASVPFIGPALGAAAAASAIIAGGVQIKKIKDQKFGQGGAGGSFTGGGNVGAGGGGVYTGGLAGGAPLGGQQNQTITIPLMIDGEVIHQVSVNANDNASQQGLPSFEKAS